MQTHIKRELVIRVRNWHWHRVFLNCHSAWLENFKLLPSTKMSILEPIDTTVQYFLVLWTFWTFWNYFPQKRKHIICVKPDLTHTRRTLNHWETWKTRNSWLYGRNVLVAIFYQLYMDGSHYQKSQKWLNHKNDYYGST